MTTSKSPRRVLQVAYDAARQALPARRHRFSPKKFTRPRPLACLVLKGFLRLDYRGSADHTDLARLIDLKALPRFTAFRKAVVRRFKAAPAGAVFDAVRDRALPAEADFDGEWVHEHVRSFGARTLIPPERGRPPAKPPAGGGGAG